MARSLFCCCWTKLVLENCCAPKMKSLYGSSLYFSLRARTLHCFSMARILVLVFSAGFHLRKGTSKNLRTWRAQTRKLNVAMLNLLFLQCCFHRWQSCENYGNGKLTGEMGAHTCHNHQAICNCRELHLATLKYFRITIKNNFMLSQGYTMLEYWQHKYVVLWGSGQAICIRMFLQKQLSPDLKK